MSSGVMTNSEVVMIDWGEEHRVYALARYRRIMRTNDLDPNISVTE